ncbi:MULTISPECIES: hypothetical protein [unclassified Methylobacterium]|uniref:hypothetical protein n=1 Tax=unclassified Methylobacterium TaxID=2615210 RepID=UPI0011C20557|nr:MULTISPECIES: hypothetical protein [unclassified Methylobacterium]QEE41573.1 hypothetical protein FVA80_24130 [Methylobacterium sp. WL1]TXN57049.1 hypothetical protein FV241_12555 [Methylobacterium sp. WL2]
MSGVRITRKVGIAGERDHRAIVSTMMVNGRPQVRLRLRAGAGESSKATDRIELTVAGADAMMAAIRSAIEAAELDSASDDIRRPITRSPGG